MTIGLGRSEPSPALPALSAPTLPSAIAWVIGGVAAVAVIASVWFGAQPAQSGAVALGLLLVCFAAHMFGVAKGERILAAAAMAGMVLAIWHFAFGEMWIRWFPGWKRYAAMPLTTRLGAGDSYYSHGPLVPLACIVIAYLIYRRVGVPTGRTRSSTLWGGLIFSGSLFMQIMAARGEVTFVSGFALIGTLAGLVILWGGWPLARAYWLPVAFLFFMVPLPMDWIAKVNFALKTRASIGAVWLTNNVMGIPAILDGSTVNLPPTAEGEAKKLVVENVCSGLRSMISLVCFATLFALVCRVKGGWRLLMLALAFPIAIACNVVRITSMTIVSHHWSVEAAGPESWFHMASGVGVFAIALGFMFLVEQIIILAARKFNKDWTDSRLLGYLDELPPSSATQLRLWHPGAATALLIVGAMTILYSYEVSLATNEKVAKQAVPRAMLIGGHNYINREEGKMSTLEMTILETEDYLRRQYVREGATPMDNHRPVNLSIIFSRNNRKGTHPPDVCIEGSGARIVEKQLLALPGSVVSRNYVLEYAVWVPLAAGGAVLLLVIGLVVRRTVVRKQPLDRLSKRVAGVGVVVAALLFIVAAALSRMESGETTPQVRELISQQGDEHTLHWYLYKCGDAYTHDYFTQQLIIFLNGVFDRNASGALIRIDVPIGPRLGGEDEATARELAAEAATAFMPQIDQRLGKQQPNENEPQP